MRRNESYRHIYIYIYIIVLRGTAKFAGVTGLQLVSLTHTHAIHTITPGCGRGQKVPRRAAAETVRACIPMSTSICPTFDGVDMRKSIHIDSKIETSIYIFFWGGLVGEKCVKVSFNRGEHIRVGGELLADGAGPRG